MLPNACQVERRADGAIVVRVRSHDRCGQPLPDAVFAFRLGDCQYAKWDQYLRKQDIHRGDVDRHVYEQATTKSSSARQAV